MKRTKTEHAPELYSAISRRLKELRTEAGYTNQESFAYEAKIPRAQYGRYEKGTNLTIRSLNKILQFHEISFEKFFKGVFN